MLVSRRIRHWRTSILVSCAIAVHAAPVFSQAKGRVAIGINYQNIDAESRNKIEGASVTLETRVKDADLLRFHPKDSTGLQIDDFKNTMKSSKIGYGIIVDLKSEGSSIVAKYILLDNQTSTEKVVVDRKFSKGTFIKNEFVKLCMKIIDEIPPPTTRKPWYIKRWREIVGGAALAAFIIVAGNMKDRSPNNLPPVQ